MNKIIEKIPSYSTNDTYRLELEIADLYEGLEKKGFERIHIIDVPDLGYELAVFKNKNITIVYLFGVTDEIYACFSQNEKEYRAMINEALMTLHTLLQIEISINRIREKFDEA